MLEAVHAAGALAYMDGANMNAILGKFKPGAAGFDVMHFNLHKTFSTPHGGGGPGAGPVAVRSQLAPFLPWPRVLREGEAYRLERARRAALVDRARAGIPGQRRRARPRLDISIRRTAAPASSRSARTPCSTPTTCAQRVGEAYAMPYEQVSKHEFVASATPIKQRTGVRTLDIAKRLIDYGYHPPTIYFPLIVEECLLVEPTETEAVETLDAFAEALIAIVAEADSEPQLLKTRRTTHRCGGSTRPPPRVSQICAGGP